MWLALPYMSHEERTLLAGAAPLLSVSPLLAPQSPDSSDLPYPRPHEGAMPTASGRQVNDSTLCLNQNFHPQMTEVPNDSSSKDPNEERHSPLTAPTAASEQGLLHLQAELTWQAAGVHQGTDSPGPGQSTFLSHNSLVLGAFSGLPPVNI